MHLTENEDLIKVEGLAQIMKEISEEEIDIKKLDKISLVLLYGLAEYLVNSKVSLEKALKKYIYPQNVEVDGTEFIVDIIDSEDFFNVLKKLGIMEEKEYKELKEFLCIAPEYEDKLVINKLKKAIEEVTNNQELRDMIHQGLL